MSFYSVVDFIRENYPEYFGVKEYRADECVRIWKIEEEWGVFSNFYKTPLTVRGVDFACAEELFQLMKFRDPRVIKQIRLGVTANGKRSAHVKMTAKSYEKAYRRLDWGMMILDALKYCLVTKYEQSPLFREKLAQSAGRYIVEDQTIFLKKHPDAWGVKLQPDGKTFVGPNLLGRLLMELRDGGGKLGFTRELPSDAFAFMDVLSSVGRV